jgi:hypothetical protein
MIWDLNPRLTTTGLLYTRSGTKPQNFISPILSPPIPTFALPDGSSLPAFGGTAVAVFFLRPYNKVLFKRKLEIIEDYPWTVELF